MTCCKLIDKFSTVLISKREELTHLILKLLQAWKEPLSHFNQHHQELPDDSLSKAKQISNMVHELKTGVEKVTEKVRFSVQLLFFGGGQCLRSLGLKPLCQQRLCSSNAGLRYRYRNFSAKGCDLVYGLADT